MMTNICGCDRPCREGFTLCSTNQADRPSCRTELEKHLAEMRWLDEQLDIALTGSHGIDYRTLGGAKAGTIPLPWNERASRARNALKNELVGWVRILQTGNEPAPADNLPAIAAWLLSRLNRITRHEAAGDIHIGIVTRFQKAIEELDRAPKERHRIGKCEGQILDNGETITEVTCAGDVYAELHGLEAECKTCRRYYDAPATKNMRDTMLTKLDDYQATAYEIAQLTPHMGFKRLATETVRQQVIRWHKGGRLEPRGTGDQGQAKFRFRDARDMLLRTYRDKIA